MIVETIADQVAAVEAIVTEVETGVAEIAEAAVIPAAEEEEDEMKVLDNKELSHVTAKKNQV